MNISKIYKHLHVYLHQNVAIPSCLPHFKQKLNFFTLQSIVRQFHRKRNLKTKVCQPCLTSFADGSQTPLNYLTLCQTKIFQHVARTAHHRLYRLFYNLMLVGKQERT